jgi:hypothetical protein
METSKMKEIEIKFQEMLKFRKQFQAMLNFKPAQTGTCHVIRRRKGENDKRIPVAKSTNPPRIPNFPRRNEISSAR